MKTKIKQILISFISMLIINFAFSFSNFWDLGISSPYLGLLYVLGLIFGPYGALGAVFANTIIDLMNGYSISIIIPSEIFTFGISYLAYKLWYSGFKTNKITKPILDKYIKKDTIKTNIDMIIGKTGIVTEDITPLKCGRVKLQGKSFMAISDKEIKKDKKVEILKIEGVKVIVKEKE